VRNLRRAARHDLEHLTKDGDATKTSWRAPRRTSTSSPMAMRPRSIRLSSTRRKSCSRSEPKPAEEVTPWLDDLYPASENR